MRATLPSRSGSLRRLRVGSLTAAALATAIAGLAPLPPAAALELDPQIQEIRTLLREKRYPLALESLRLIARQIQDLRLEAIAPAFPPAPAGWTAQPALSLLEEDEIWSSRIHAQRIYAAPGPARMELVVDLRSPFAPAAALGLNPLAVAADPLARLAQVGGEKGLLRFNPDTGEGEVIVVLDREILVRATGRGINSIQIVVELAAGVDYPFLRATANR